MRDVIRRMRNEDEQLGTLRAEVAVADEHLERGASLYALGLVGPAEPVRRADLPGRVKTLRGSCGKAGAVHLLSAYAAKARLVLASRIVSTGELDV